jgi:hypothetical protein
VEYAYLVASLPGLEFGAEAPLTSQELLQSSGGVLREDHWEDLRAIVESRPQDAASPEARLYVDAETQLRNALARLRAQRVGVEPALHIRRHNGYDLRIETAAAEAMAAESPLERELALDRHRWALLDEIAALPSFGLQAVFAYAFKLQIVEKWSRLSQELGEEVAERITETNLAGSGV